MVVYVQFCDRGADAENRLTSATAPDAPARRTRTVVNVGTAQFAATPRDDGGGPVLVFARRLTPRYDRAPHSTPETVLECERASLDYDADRD